MVKVGILDIGSSEWAAATLFPPKKPRSTEFRMVYNFKPINKYTIKSNYPIYNMDKVLHTVVSLGKKVFSVYDTANGY